MTERYRSDYPTRKIGGGNPYLCCSVCGVAEPQINGRLEGHLETCAWRRAAVQATSVDDRLLKIRAIAQELKGIVDDGSSETLVDQILALTGDR